MNTLRDFYYLDEKTLQNYVSTIEDGIEMEKQTSVNKNNPNWNFELSTGEMQKVLIALGIPIPELIVGRNGKTQSFSINRTLQPTMSSLFKRLETYLEPAIQYLEGFDREIWNQIEEGQFIKCSCRVELSKGYEYATMFKQAEEFVQMASTFDIELDGVDDIQGAFKYGQKAIEKKTQKIKLLPLGSPSSSQMYFVCSINTDYLEVDLDDMAANNYTVLGRVEKVLTQGEKYTIFDPTLTGISNSINREQRRAKKKQPKQDNQYFSEKDLYAKKPAVIIKPIALFK